jgi:thiol-disulfide isomerase/thioredoxin
MTLPKKIIVGALFAALYLLCAYAAQLGTVPLNIRYMLSGGLFAFWPLLFITLTIYAIHSAWKTRQRDSILLVITSLILTGWMAPIMLRMSYYCFQAAFTSEQPLKLHTASSANKSAEEEKAPAASSYAKAPADKPASIEEITTEKHLQKLIAASSQQPLVVKIFATWCGPCQQMVPNYKAVAAQLHDSITFTEVNFDMFDNKDALNVRGLPTIICYKDGKEAFRVGGYRTKEQLKDEISKLL